MARITINPVTRVEGHGRIEIFLNHDGHVERAYFQVPELRGFEKFVVGRPAEDMPQITSRICGVCPTAHHMASTRALDALYQVETPPAARKLRELVYCTFMVEDHALHFYFLGGPDFVAGPDAPRGARNVLGVIAKVGAETATRVIATRRKLRELVASVAGKAIHPVFGLPGGVARPLGEEEAAAFRAAAAEAVDFAQFTLALFNKLVLGNSAYLDLIRSATFTHQTYYMGLVDAANQVNFYSGELRVVSPDGHQWARFAPADYGAVIEERTDAWSFMKSCHLKPLGPREGIYCVGPLARLNAADGMATPLAAEEYLRYFGALGRPVHHTLAAHWARLIEMLYAAERMRELANDPEITGTRVRAIPAAVPARGVGVVEAPRGTLIHDYQADGRGCMTKASLLVATQHSAARISMGIEKAARDLIKGAEVSDGVLNMVEMSLRAYDPCLGCATHALPGSMPLIVAVRAADGEIVATLRRDSDGSVHRN